MSITALAPPAASLNPAQQQVLEMLGAHDPDDRPLFDADLRDELHADLVDGLAPVVEQLPPGGVLCLSKHQLSSVHGCETRLLAEKDEPFEWTVALARGTVAHKAIELSVFLGGETPPMALVEEAIASLLGKDTALADWLERLSPTEHAELQLEANDRVAKFLECFPPLSRRWVPVTESRLRVELFDGKVLLLGRSDLTLGRPQGCTARKVIIDLKTGGFSPSHVDDLRFYALLETIRVGVPPRMTASYYLDSGRPHPERITDAVLRAAVARTVDGAERLVQILHGNDPPVTRAGAACRWCKALATCPEGKAFLHLGGATDAFD